MNITATVLPSKEAFDGEIALSVSKGKTFDDCRAKFKFNYIEHLPRKEWDFHVFGKFCHQVLEDFHGELLEHPEKGKDWETLLRETFSATYEYDYKKSMTKKQLNDALKIIDEYADLLDEEGLPEVTAVEKSFYIQLNDRVLLNGFIDRIQMDPDGIIHVADYKTTKDKRYLKDFFQLMTYSYVLMMEDPSLERVRASFILLRHGFDFMTEEYTREDIIPIGDKFIEYADSIKEEKLWRPSPQFLCKYCDFLDACRAGRSFLVKRGVIEKKNELPKVGLTKW
jgi:ATP-dependent helicase/DNAse subunit B